MSISYSAITNHGKVTLPSVETWGTNMNILRDPPKSITTRKIDKVGNTSELTQMIQESGDRSSEAIRVYARAVNPMVSVSYDNYGNNGGQRNGTTKGNAFLPHRIMRDGAFRPPIRDQRQLLPLSRLPRAWTSSYTQPGFSDFSKKAMCPTDDLKGVKKADQMLNAYARPTSIYKMEMPIIENYEITRVIKNPIMVNYQTEKQSKVRLNGDFGIPTKEINLNPLKINTKLNKSGYTKNNDVEANTDKYLQDTLHSDMDSNINIRYTKNNEDIDQNREYYIQDTLHSNIDSNVSQNIGITSIDEIFQIDNRIIKDAQNITYNTHQTSYNKYDYIHKDVELEKTLPYYQVQTNIGQNIYKRNNDQISERSYSLNKPNTSAQTNLGVRNIQKIDDISSKNYKLKPVVNPGGFDPVPNLPLLNRENQLLDFDSEKTKLRQRVYDMSQGRNTYIDGMTYQPREMTV